MNEVSDMLARIGLFEGLNIRQLLHLTSKLNKQELAAGDYLFQVGDPGDAMYIVYRGFIQVFLPDERGERVVLNEFHSGQSFGEMALLDKENRSASAVAVEPTLLYRLREVDFWDCVAWWPRLAENLLRDVSGKLRHSADQVHSLAESLALLNRQLQETDRFKSEFIGVINHKLLTPFANIDFSLQILRRYGLDNLEAGQREEVEAVMGHIQTAHTMARNLVTFAAFVQKQGELRLEPIDFAQVVGDVLQVLRPLAENKTLALQVHLAENLPVLQGDSGRLAEAVHHLVHNAIKFTPSDGRVVIQGAVDNQMLSFQVTDTGVGVPADKLESIWEGFSQMADPLRRGVEGLGLGLTLVRYVVQAHGGQVWARSKEGQGSQFGFTLPLEPVKLSADSLARILR